MLTQTINMEVVSFILISSVSFTTSCSQNTYVGQGCTPRHKALRQGHSLTLGRGECHDQWPMLKKSKEECFTFCLLGLIVCENAETEWHPHQWQVVPCSLFCSKFPYHDQIMTKLFPHSQLSPSKLIRPSNTQSIKLLNSYLAMHSIWIQPPHWRYGPWTFSMVGGKDVTNAMPRIITQNIPLAIGSQKRNHVP